LGFCTRNITNTPGNSTISPAAELRHLSAERRAEEFLLGLDVGDVSDDGVRRRIVLPLGTTCAIPADARARSEKRTMTARFIAFSRKRLWAMGYGTEATEGGRLIGRKTKRYSTPKAR
jgi:hypothetical protein